MPLASPTPKSPFPTSEQLLCLQWRRDLAAKQNLHIYTAQKRSLVFQGTTIAPFKTSHQEVVCIGLVKGSASCVLVGIQATGYRPWRRSARSSCRRAARSIAKRRSVGTRGTPVRWRCSVSDLQSDRQSKFRVPRASSSFTSFPSSKLARRARMYCAFSNPSTQDIVSAPKALRQTRWQAWLLHSRRLRWVPVFSSSLASPRKMRCPSCEATLDRVRFARRWRSPP